MGRITLKKRDLLRKASCSLCECSLDKGQKIISFYTIKRSGHHIILCLDCAAEIGNKVLE